MLFIVTAEKYFSFIPCFSMSPGLCGNYNGETTDDFMTSMDIVEGTAPLFVDSWRSGNCPAAIERDTDPCSMSQLNSKWNGLLCQIAQFSFGVMISVNIQTGRWGPCSPMVQLNYKYQTFRSHWQGHRASRNLYQVLHRQGDSAPFPTLHWNLQ